MGFLLIMDTVRQGSLFGRENLPFSFIDSIEKSPDTSKEPRLSRAMDIPQCPFAIHLQDFHRPGRGPAPGSLGGRINGSIARLVTDPLQNVNAARYRLHRKAR